jgi:hypothetical protein
MQAGLIKECNVTMTDSTALFRWVSYYADMGGVFVFGVAITAVTHYAANLTMNIF